MTKEEAIKILRVYRFLLEGSMNQDKPAFDLAIESLSAEKEKENGTFVNRDNCNFNCSDSNRTLVEPKWITDRKPMEDGRYMVTVKGIVCDRFIDLMFYGKPLMPNRDVKRMCWYDSDDEWGDIVYDDKDILAWMPLPKPYGEENEE